VKSRDLIEALVAVLGVYELIQGLGAIAYIIPFDGNAEAWPSVSIVLNAAVLLVLGAGLLATRGWLADRLAPSTDEAAAVPGTLMETLLAAAGVYLVVVALASGAAVAASDYLRAYFVRELSGQPAQLHEVWPPRVRVLVQLGLGVWLAVGRSGIAAALTSLRRAGRHRTAV